MPQPLSGLCGGRRPRLRLGLSRPDWRGADAEPDRGRRGQASTERVDLLRALRKRLPGQDTIAENDAALARTRIREEAEPAGLSQCALALGLGDAAAHPLPCSR